MELKEKLERELNRRKEFCRDAITRYNKRLPKKLLIAFGICLLYSCIRVQINPEEKISFYTTLLLIASFFFVIVLIEHVRLLKRIKKDIKEVDEQITALRSEGLI